MKVDFFIVGAPKAGTTSLYHYLNEHPEITMSSIKEPNYFSIEDLSSQKLYYKNKNIATLEEYHNLFNDTSDSTLKGEASVSYLFYKNVARRIKDYNNNAKIIIMIRNPAERAFSHYLMDRKLGLVSDSFDDIINKKSTHKNAKLFYQQYIEVSEYYSQVRRYLDVFDRKNIFFVDYEDLKNDIANVVKKVYIFLGVNENFVAKLEKKHNTFTMPRNHMIGFIYSVILLRNIFRFIFPKPLAKIISSRLFSYEKKPKLEEANKLQLNLLFLEDTLKLNEILEYERERDQ